MFIQVKLTKQNVILLLNLQSFPGGFFILSNFPQTPKLIYLGCGTVQAFQTRNIFTQENGIFQGSWLKFAL